MDLIILLCVIQMVSGTKVAFYNEQSVATLQPPEHLPADSFFGFSTTYDRYNKRLVISAPRKNYVGEVYECDLKNINNASCTIIGNPIAKNVSESKHDYWFGATVRSGSNFILACSPRYRYKCNLSDSTQSHKIAGTSGRCYRRKEKENAFQCPLILEQEAHSGHENDTAGWSLDIAENDAIIIGSPGMYNNTGSAAIFPYIHEMEWNNQFKRIDKVEENTHNFGYSVAIGYFLDGDELSYAVSSTYGTGEVYFYKYYNSEFEGPIKLEKGMDTEVVGSMFGAVLCVAQINKFDKKSDLIVGAPTYASESGYDTGAVYVYIVQNKWSPLQFRRRIVGHKSGSYFGHAIITVGDLNGDGHDEIAIGAPYEDNGVVYLYSGADLNSDMTEHTLMWLQMIESPGYKSFGYSLAALQDYDDNGCNELAVSAPFEDKVMLFKCIAALTITKSYAIFPSFKNHTKSKQEHFVFEVCMDLKYPMKPNKILANLSTDVQLHHTYAKLSNLNKGDLYTFEINLADKRPTYCQEVNFTLPLNGNYSIGITYKMTTKLLKSQDPEEIKVMNNNSIILSDTSELTHLGTVWAATCDGEECVANLSMKITSNITERPFIIGTHAKGTFDIEIHNTGEITNNPCIQFNISGATIQNLPMDCFKHKTFLDTWVCVPRKSVATNETWVIKNIMVDLQSLTNKNQNMTLTAKLFENCNTNSSQVYFYSIPLKSHFKGIDIKGTTNIGDIFITENALKNSVHFAHSYTITNNEPTNFKEVIVEVDVKETAFFNYSYAVITNENTIWDGTYERCKEDPNSEALKVICTIDNLQNHKAVKIIIFMKTVPLYLTYEILHIQNVMANSTLYLAIPNHASVNVTRYEKFSSVSTLIGLSEAVVPPWRVLDGSLLGLALFIILYTILYECGYLKRKHKENLKKLKEHVKQQINMQSTTEQLQSNSELEPSTADDASIHENGDSIEEASCYFY